MVISNDPGERKSWISAGLDIGQLITTINLLTGSSN
jgi:hypothetical protein